MNNKKIFLLAVVLLPIFTSFKAQNVTVNSALNNVLSIYYDIKNSLVADNNTEAKNKAKELSAAVSAVPVDKMDTNQQQTWAAVKDKLLLASKQISEGKLTEQRDNFTTLSQNMFDVFNRLKINTTPIYRQYCPMKKAIWLSEIQNIKNPYYGKQMLTCGNTTATLPAETR